LTPSAAASSKFLAGLTSANQNFKKGVNEHFKLITSAIAKDSWVNRELLAVGAM
jgi:hypothetical protein